jgi:hypothetical protein
VTRETSSEAVPERALEVVAGADAGRRIPFGVGSVVIGRDLLGGLEFSDDPLMSHRHAAITISADGSGTVADLASTNGTFVNGRRVVGSARVVPGDVISLGRTEFRLASATSPADPDSQIQQTRVAPVTQSAQAWVSWAEQTWPGQPGLIHPAVDAAMSAIARGAGSDEAAAAAYAAAETAATAESRRAWQAWAAQAYAGDPRRIQAAAEAALSALALGATVDQATAAARAAAESEAAPVFQSAERASGGRASASPGQRDGRLRGRVSGFQQRYESSGRRQVYVWDFQLELPGSSGGEHVAIEMRGFGFKGAVQDGDEVEIAGRGRPGRVNRVRRLKNLTSDSRVKVRGHPSVTRAVGVLATVIVLIGFAVIALFIVTHIHGNS